MVGGGLQIERDTESRLEKRTGGDDTIDTAVLGIAGEMFFPQSIDLLFSSLLFSARRRLRRLTIFNDTNETSRRMIRMRLR